MSIGLLTGERSAGMFASGISNAEPMANDQGQYLTR